MPGNRILVENESKNTSQNVELALAEVAKEPGLDRFSSVVAVMKWYHARRAMMTLRHHLPQGLRHYSESYEPKGCRRGYWHLNDDGFYGKRNVHKEWRLIPELLEEAKIAEVRFVDDAFV